MSREIDIRSLIMDKVSSEYSVATCDSFIKGNSLFSEQLIFRNFNSEMWWSSNRQTEYIESVYMGCEFPPIVLFEVSSNPVKYVVCDGLNRIFTIQNFLSDKLRLAPSGIKKAKFLEGKTFSELSVDAQEYFRGRSIQILKYSYNDKSHQLTEDEVEEIAKQFYLRYNSGIRLKNEEMQKADYEDDEVTKKISLLLKDKTFVDKLRAIYFAPQKDTKTFYESILMYCRLAITSCYAPLNLFCNQKSILKKIDMFYRDYTAEINKDIIVSDFVNIVDCLYELTKQEYWKNTTKLHNQNFMLITYWLIFNIRKYNLMELKDFSWYKYIVHFGRMEEEKPLFSIYYVNIKERYTAIINYVDERYKLNLNTYVVQELKPSSIEKVDTFEKLPRYNFQLARDGITVSALIEQLKRESFILRPSYQRKEINDIKASSFLIESLILNMALPDILVYRHEDKNGKTIFEVVDGQQRCFSLLAYLNERYTNYFNEPIASEKEGFALEGLTVCQDLNNKKMKATKRDYVLDDRYIDKIRNGKIRIVYIPEKDNPYFSVKDYFTSINKTIIPLKKTSFKYWNVCYDKKLMQLANEIARKFQGKVLPKMDNKYYPQQCVVNLAYLFYVNHSVKTTFAVQQVASWLSAFNNQKYKLINEVKDEEVEILRRKYIVAFECVDAFLTKLQNWLTTENKTINELVMKKVKDTSFTDLLCLYYLLKDIGSAELINNSTHIYDLIHAFFKNSLDNNLKRREKLESIVDFQNKLSFSKS